MKTQKRTYSPLPLETLIAELGPPTPADLEEIAEGVLAIEEMTPSELRAFTSDLEEELRSEGLGWFLDMCKAERKGWTRA